jgi:hypothetical protein
MAVKYAIFDKLKFHFRQFLISKLSGSHSSEYEDDSFLGYSAV